MLTGGVYFCVARPGSAVPLECQLGHTWQRIHHSGVFYRSDAVFHHPSGGWSDGTAMQCPTSLLPRIVLFLYETALGKEIPQAENVKEFWRPINKERLEGQDKRQWDVGWPKILSKRSVDGAAANDEERVWAGARRVALDVWIEWLLIFCFLDENGTHSVAVLITGGSTCCPAVKSRPKFGIVILSTWKESCFVSLTLSSAQNELGCKCIPVITIKQVFVFSPDCKEHTSEETGSDGCNGSSGFSAHNT